MVLIINQHKGSHAELEAHITNYLEQYRCNKFFMELVIDSLTNPLKTYKDSMDWVDDLNEKYLDRLHISWRSGETGLSQCRRQAILNYTNSIGTPKWVFFGCTNSRWIMPLDEHAYKLIAVYDVTLWKCKYPAEYTWTPLGSGPCSFSKYFNCIDRNDYSICMPYSFLHLQDMTVGNEKYTPEEILLYKATSHGEYPLIIHEDVILQEAWYNKTGMTATFSRENSVLPNRGGFFKRAQLLLTGFTQGKLPLTNHTLKMLAYDYVTLAESFSFKEFKGTVVEPVLKWALMKWVDDDKYNHKIKFIE